MFRVLSSIGLLAAAVLQGQQYVISTYAGGGPPPLRTATPALQVSISPSGVAADARGNVYFGTAGGVVLRLDGNGVLTRIAGTRGTPYPGDGSPAIDAQLSASSGIAIDAAGNIFIADRFRVRRVSPDGIITTVAGNGTFGFSGDGGPATDAQLGGVMGLAIDSSGNLFIADPVNNRIREVFPSGIITTIAGNGSAGFSGDGGPATKAQLWLPYGVAVDSNGNLFISDHANRRVRKVAANGLITTVVGNGSVGFSGDGGPATSAQLTGTFSVAADNGGNLFVEDHSSRRIRKVSPDGIITTFAGGGAAGLGDDGPATSAQVGPSWGIALDNAGNLFIADVANSRIRRVSTSGIITTVAGNGAGFCCSDGDGGPATDAQLYAEAVALDNEASLILTDRAHDSVRKVSANGIITRVAGNGTTGFSGDGGPATSAQLTSPGGVAMDTAGNLFIADSIRIRKVSPGGTITTVAGGGTLAGAAPDGGPATSAQLDTSSVAVDRAGNLFIADRINNRIRKVSRDGIITTLAGNGTYGFAGDGGPAASAPLLGPTAVTVDAGGNVFFVDGVIRVRKVTPDGIIHTVAGGGSGNCYLDGVPAASIALCYATGVAVDSAGNLFISTSALDDGPYNERVRKVTPDGIITTVAGVGPGGFGGDGGPAQDAWLSEPEGVAVDGAGNVYVADYGNSVVRILRPGGRPVWIGAVVDAASQKATPVAPGKLVVIYGAGLGPAKLVSQPGPFSTELAGTTVSFNGMPSQILYSSSRAVAAIAPFALTGTTAQVIVTSHGESSDAFTVSTAPSSPGLFTVNQTGAGQAAALNADGSVNSAVNPVKAGDSVTLYATGEGWTPVSDPPFFTACDALLHPALPVSVTVGGVGAAVTCAGRRADEAAMRVTVQVPKGVQPGGYVPVVLKVGEASTTPGAVWIAVSAN